MSEADISVERPVASSVAVPAGTPAATPATAPAAAQAPTVYFIDDSATMREVIKIAFRKENLHVVACHDAASAIAQMEQTSPDVVISDVIMPDKDGYEVCQHIKGHPRLAHTPVILMSGVVNRMVADKALAVKADELIRKPFQPQELIARVKQLLKAQGASTASPAAAAAPTPIAAAAPSATAPSATVSATRAWSNLFAANTATDMKRPAATASSVTAPTATPAPPAAPPTPAGMPVRLAAAPVAPPSALATPARETAAESRQPTRSPQAAPPLAATQPPSLATQKLHVEVQRLEQLVKKLRSELEAERIYCRSLEENVKTLQEATG
ncbi:MAG: response regulator [Acidipila sp.]|nr:response regulator [Acidipila sp.]